MRTIGEKLKDIRKHKGLTQAEFGNNIGFSKQAVSNIENNLSNPSIDFISKLIMYYDVNANWFIVDKGEMFNSQQEMYKTTKNEIMREVEQMLNTQQEKFKTIKIDIIREVERMLRFRGIS